MQRTVNAANPANKVNSAKKPRKINLKEILTLGTRFQMLFTKKRFWIYGDGSYSFGASFESHRLPIGSYKYRFIDLLKLK